MEIDIVHLIEILVGFFVGTLTAVGVLVSYLSKSDKSAFKNLRELYDTLEVRLRNTEKENKALKALIEDYKDSQELMQAQMVNLNNEKNVLEKKYQEREKDIKIMLGNKDKEIAKLKQDVMSLTRKVQLLGRGTGSLKG